MNIDWLQIAVNVCAVLGAVGALCMWYKGYIIDQVKLAVNSQMVLKADYERDKGQLEQELSNIRKFDSEFAVLKTKMEFLQADTADIKKKVDNLPETIAGAIQKVYQANR